MLTKIVISIIVDRLVIAIENYEFGDRQAPVTKTTFGIYHKQFASLLWRMATIHELRGHIGI